MKSFPLYSDCRWNGFSKTEELGKQLSFAIMYIHSFFLSEQFYENKILDFGKKKDHNNKKNKAKNKVRHPEQSKVSRLVILKLKRTKHRNRAWLTPILYCMQTSLLSLFYFHTLT